jgi:hypothetical protein
VIEKRQTERGVEHPDLRIEGLTRELASVINAGSVEQRERLRDMAVRLLRDEVEIIDERAASVPASGHSFNPFGIGIPLSLIGGVMLILFPPVGLMLFAAAALMMVWGLAAVLVARR